MESAFDPQKAKAELEELLNYQMPFGKYKNRKLIDLPVEYLIWFKQKGLPSGKLGRYMQIVLQQKGG